MIITDKEQLRKECKDVSIFEAQDIVTKLEAELQNSNIIGIGLAANQIGIDAKVCIIRTEESLNLANPVIVEKHDLMVFRREGCLSFPNKWITTKRYNEILITDLFHPAGVVCTGLEAVVVQHEIGHLFGELMYDYQIKIPGRNIPCWCGSERKFKKCCLGKEID